MNASSGLGTHWTGLEARRPGLEWAQAGFLVGRDEVNGGAPEGGGGTWGATVCTYHLSM